MTNLVRHNFDKNEVEVFCWDIESHIDVPVLIDQDSLKPVAALNGTWFVVRTSKLNKTQYAVMHIDGRAYYMHRLISQPGANLESAHANGNGLDNRKRNLNNLSLSNHRSLDHCRPGLPPTSRNKTGYRGVQKTPGGKFVATFGNHPRGTYTFLGTYETAQQASNVYQAFVKKEHARRTRSIIPARRKAA